MKLKDSILNHLLHKARKVYKGKLDVAGSIYMELATLDRLSKSEPTKEETVRYNVAQTNFHKRVA